MAPPVSGRVIGRRVRVAANLIHCHGKNGEKLTLRVGDPIPDDATGIPAGAIVEKEV